MVCIGHVRVIHFEFDMKKDTAMSVAGEMISELNLGDQDVIRIAELIDAAILALLPGWRSNVGNKQSSFNGNEINQSTISEESNGLSQSKNDPMAWINVSKQPQIDNLMMHGRFEVLPEEDFSSPSLSAVDDDWDSDCQ